MTKTTRICFNGSEKSMNMFTGDDTYLITNWIQEFEDAADIMGWTNIERLLYGKRLLEGTAKLFLRTVGSIKSWELLKELLQEEFCPKLNCYEEFRKQISMKNNLQTHVRPNKSLDIDVKENEVKTPFKKINDEKDDIKMTGTESDMNQKVTKYEKTKRIKTVKSEDVHIKARKKTNKEEPYKECYAENDELTKDDGRKCVKTECKDVKNEVRKENFDKELFKDYCVKNDGVTKEDGRKSFTKIVSDDIKIELRKKILNEEVLIEEKSVESRNEKRCYLREEAEDDIQKVQDENRKYYHKHRKKRRFIAADERAGWPCGIIFKKEVFI